MSLFRRTSEPTLVDEAVLVIDQHALPYRSPDWYGHANYHVRVFRPENVRKPIVIMGDLANDPIASITNKCPEVTAIAADLVLGRPGVHPSRLEDHARWVTYFPAATFGESFTEVHGFGVVPGYEPQLVTNRYRHLRREDAEELVGGSLRTWQRHHYTVARLQRRGVRVMRVHSSGQGPL